MKVYHGGTDHIERPLANKGRMDLDFGQGFYLTDIKEQAEKWASRIAKMRNRSPLLNVYELDIERARSLYRYKKFSHYDLEWLQFIVNNRLGENDWQAYDIIEGGIADDRVIDTVELFMGGYLPAELAIERLKHFAPNNQICITHQQAIDSCLTFVESFALNP